MTSSHGGEEFLGAAYSIAPSDIYRCKTVKEQGDSTKIKQKTKKYTIKSSEYKEVDGKETDDIETTKTKYEVSFAKKIAFYYPYTKDVLRYPIDEGSEPTKILTDEEAKHEYKLRKKNLKYTTNERKLATYSDKTDCDLNCYKKCKLDLATGVIEYVQKEDGKDP